MTNEVPAIILDQLGGKRFIAMTGCKDFVGSATTLAFKLPRVTNGISHVSITLDVNDTYRVEFTKWNNRKLEMTIIAVYNNVYCDMLQNVFTDQTGLHTSL